MSDGVPVEAAHGFMGRLVTLKLGESLVIGTRYHKLAALFQLANKHFLSDAMFRGFTPEEFNTVVGALLKLVSKTVAMCRRHTVDRCAPNDGVPSIKRPGLQMDSGGWVRPERSLSRPRFLLKQRALSSRNSFCSALFVACRRVGFMPGSWRATPRARCSSYSSAGAFGSVCS